MTIYASQTNWFYQIRCLGSAALNLCCVASGELDAYYQVGIHAWDMAAGILILKEAGGCLGSLTCPGQAFELKARSVFVASTVSLFAQLGDIISPLKTKEFFSFDPDVLE